VTDLVSNAKAAANAIENGDLDAVGLAMDEYWEQKKVMAGPSSGVEPDKPPKFSIPCGVAV
jgi:hypothetical protein